jgi:competence ComEA-like helix-hairpin-helix protein
MMELTKQERQVIVFVLAVSLAGIGLQFLAKRVPPLERRRCLENLGKVELNSADKETLQRIPGIGEKLAMRIIEYRIENDGFSDVDELSKIKGIRAALLGKLKECVYVR